jgi:prepilin signal peptidase PulO-like enzyme (type II secretory pathway)
MMVNRAMALLALAVFIGFLSVIAFKLNRIDLFVLIAICLALAVYDLWTQLGHRRR